MSTNVEGGEPGSSQTEDDQPGRFRLEERYLDPLILLLLAILALIPRLYRIGSVPQGLNGDELFNAIDALRLGPGNWQIYFEGNFGREALFLYLMAIPLNLFGEEVWALRLPAVFLGTGSVLLAYLIGKQAFNRRVGLVGGVFMAVSLWPMMQARWGLRAVSLTFFTALTIYLYGRVMHREDKALIGWLAAGFSLGLTMYTYIPARLFPLVVAGWLGWYAILQRDWLRDRWRRILFSFAIALIVFAPFAAYIFKYPDKFDQRVSGLLEAAENKGEENPVSLLDNALSVPLMFAFRGDPAGRYHVAERPVFDPVTGLFFLTGIATSIWLAFRKGADHLRRANHGLLLLWIVAMLASIFVTGLHTSFLRGAGAIVPVYLSLAIGVDFVYSWFCNRWPDRNTVWRWSLVGLVSAGVLLTMFDSWRAYFLTWINDPVARSAWHADLGSIGRYLNENPPPSGTQLFIAYDFVLDMSPKNFNYISDEVAVWFDYQNSFAWHPDGGESWYIASATKPLNRDISDLLNEHVELEQVEYENDELAFTIYRLHENEIEWNPGHEFELGFGDGPRLIGFDLPDEIYRGDTVRLTSHWQVPEELPDLPNQLTYIQAHLEDANGNVWSQADSLLGYPQSSWKAEDRFVQFLDLEIPAGMPPGPAYLRFAIRDWEGSQYSILLSSPGESAIAENLAGPLFVRSRPVSEIVIESDIPVFEDVLALQGSAFSTLIAPGVPLDLSLNWLALKQPQKDYEVQLQLTLPGAKEPFLEKRFSLWPETYPPTQWQSGEQVTTFHRLEIPLDMPTSGAPLFQIHVWAPQETSPLSLTQGESTLAQMELSLRDHVFERPLIGEPLEARFGNEIELLGYDLDASESGPGGELHLTLYWRALNTPSEAYTVFNHLVGPDGQFQGQFDSPPVNDAWLTNTWLPGEVIADKRTIPIRPNAPGGLYELVIGLYTASDLVRLPVYLDGEAQANDQLVLTELMVGP